MELQSRERTILLKGWEEWRDRLHRKVTFELDLDFEQLFK